MSSSSIYLKEFLESKDDCYPLTYGYQSRSQFLGGKPLEFAHLPYVRRLSIYSDFSDKYSDYNWLSKARESSSSGWLGRGFDIRDQITGTLLLTGNPNPWVFLSDVRDVVWSVMRQQNRDSRKRTLLNVDRSNSPTLETGPRSDNYLECMKVWRPTSGEVTLWTGRPSRARCSGINARWNGRISQTNVAGFGGGGIPRPRRSDAFAEAVVKKAIRFGAPAGLVAAAKTNGQKAASADPESIMGAVVGINGDLNVGHRHELSDKRRRVITKAWERKRATKSSDMRGRLDERRKKRRLQQAGLTAVAACDDTRVSTILDQTPPRLDLVWSAESSEWYTSSSSSSSSSAGDESEWSSVADESDAAVDLEDLTSEQTKEANRSEKGEALNAADKARDEQYDSWPPADHRYTHLGPGRGKATRHLEAVNQLGFAGGGLLRERSSIILPSLDAAGTGTVGRVIPVPSGLAAAAATTRTRTEAKQNAASFIETREERPPQERQKKKSQLADDLLRHVDEHNIEEAGKGRKVKSANKQRDSGGGEYAGRKRRLSGIGGGGAPLSSRDTVSIAAENSWQFSELDVPTGLMHAVELAVKRTVKEEMKREKKDRYRAKMGKSEYEAAGCVDSEDARKDVNTLQQAEVGPKASRKEERGRRHTEDESSEVLTIISSAPGGIGAHQMRRSEVVLSVALIFVMGLYALELRSRLVL